MPKDLSDARSLTNHHWIMIIIFLLTLAIPGTYYATMQLSAATTRVSTAERVRLLKHLDSQHENALTDQAIYLKQQAFNEKILGVLTRHEKAIDLLLKH